MTDIIDGLGLMDLLYISGLALALLIIIAVSLLFVLLR